MLFADECLAYLERQKQERALAYKQINDEPTFEITLLEGMRCQININGFGNTIKTRVTRGAVGQYNNFYMCNPDAEILCREVLKTVHLLNGRKLIRQGSSGVRDAVDRITIRMMASRDRMNLPSNAISKCVTQALTQWGATTVWELAENLAPLLTRERKTILSPEYDFQLSGIDLICLDEHAPEYAYVDNILESLPEIGDRLRKDGIPQGDFRKVIEDIYEQIRFQKADSALNELIENLDIRDGFDPEWGNFLLAPDQVKRQ